MTSGGIIIQKLQIKTNEKRPYQIDFTQFSNLYRKTEKTRSKSLLILSAVQDTVNRTLNDF